MIPIACKVICFLEVQCIKTEDLKLGHNCDDSDANDNTDTVLAAALILGGLKHLQQSFTYDLLPPQYGCDAVILKALSQ